MEESILVVDDEERMRKLIKDFLTNKGYHILEAEDGEKALEIYQENKSKIMLILLDVMMPKLDGWSDIKTNKTRKQRTTNNNAYSKRRRTRRIIWIRIRSRRIYIKTI